MKYLLDTNVLSDVIRYPHGTLANRIENTDEADLFTSVFVACELRFGAELINSKRLRTGIDTVLSALHVADFSADCTEIYARVAAKLEKNGRRTGIFDTLIAAHSLSYGAVLVTDNVKHFADIEGLEVQNWKRDNASKEDE
ncbi:MAG: PIN domain-containing protein [Pseudomonadota bacterium]